uniref:Uncharacterized protein n=1 Tax=Anguilla anguilla TaxID=7936 RepID=A0A0E9QQC2_ANGAN
MCLRNSQNCAHPPPPQLPTVVDLLVGNGGFWHIFYLVGDTYRDPYLISCCTRVHRHT